MRPKGREAGPAAWEGLLPPCFNTKLLGGEGGLIHVIILLPDLSSQEKFQCTRNGIVTKTQRDKAAE